VVITDERDSSEADEGVPVTFAIESMATHGIRVMKRDKSGCYNYISYSNLLNLKG